MTTNTAWLRPYGATGITVSTLGLGLGALGDLARDESDVMRALDVARDLGVTLFDAAPSYGAAESRLGAWLRSRKPAGVIVSTKGGYGVDGVADWTPSVITAGIDQARRRLGVDCVDIFHLHSCPRDTLLRDGLLEALDRARGQGAIRVAAYSGENDALSHAIEQPTFGGVQCSVNPFDQRSSRELLPRAASRGIGVLAKRALANAPWRFDREPLGEYAHAYWCRMRAMGCDPVALSWGELCARFSAYADGVSSILVGTSRAEHLAEVAAWVRAGPLPEALVTSLRAAFDREDRGWEGQV